VAQPFAVPTELPGTRRRAVRPRRDAPGDHGLGGLLDIAQRKPVPRLAGDRRLPDVPCDEVVPFVDERYRTIADSKHRGIAGKSSGGYGAMVVPMLRPELWGAVATHAGDALFEMCYLPEFRESARALRDDYDGSYENFWKDVSSRPAFRRRAMST
jgi:hypothetical protein